MNDHPYKTPLLILIRVNYYLRITDSQEEAVAFPSALLTTQL